MGHGHDDEHGDEEAADAPIDAKPRHYWQHAMSKRAVPQFEPAEIAKKYLDDMEKGGRLHHLNKKKDR